MILNRVLFGLKSKDNIYLKACLLLVGQIAASTNQNIIKRLIEEGCFEKLAPLTFSTDLSVIKSLLWIFSNLACDSFGSKIFLEQSSLIERCLFLMRN
jgi:hypothetical protein